MYMWLFPACKNEKTKQHWNDSISQPREGNEYGVVSSTITNVQSINKNEQRVAITDIYNEMPEK